MNWFKRIGKRLQKVVKYSASDPHNFDEIWSFQSTIIRLGSLILIFVFCIGALSAYLFSGIFNPGIENVSIERSKLEDQKVLIEELNDRVRMQENYIENIRMILAGETPMKIKNDSIVDVIAMDPGKIKSKETRAENKLSKEVRGDMSTPSKTGNSTIKFFGSPVVGVISQEFNATNHPGIDVVTTENVTVKACLGGTVIYAGYTRKDGYILIVAHSGDYLSVYKHNKTLLKKVGSKVQLGDPIAIVGNSGENTDGPHLHFELWFKQSPVNPKKYMKFTR
jgi:murein DD-endopeptidase MepM/ murein hydrolase activator NlpD